MNEKIFLDLLDHYELDQNARAFCLQSPGLKQAEADCFALIEQVRNVMGYDFSDELESKIIKYLDLSVQAYYLLGLGLRQEILGALLG